MIVIIWVPAGSSTALRVITSASRIKLSGFKSQLSHFLLSDLGHWVPGLSLDQLLTNLSPMPGVYSKCSISVSYCYLFCSHLLQYIIQVRKLRLREINLTGSHGWKWQSWGANFPRPWTQVWKPSAVGMKTQCCWDDISLSLLSFLFESVYGSK